VHEHPGFISAHRAYQNVAIADHRRGELLCAYRALRDRDPDSAEGWYLWGRLQASPEAQRAAFERANELDPWSPWPLLGLGALTLGAGDVAGACRLFEAGRALAPDVPDLELGVLRGWIADPVQREQAATLLEGVLLEEPWDVERVLLLADCRERSGRSREALELLGRLLARAPWQREVARRLLARLESSATVDEIDWLARELALVADVPEAAAVVARCHALHGDAAAALAAWDVAPALDAPTHAGRRLLLVLRGDVARALELEAPRFRALEELGADVSAWHAACRIVADRDVDVAVARPALAREFVRLGFVEEALAILRPVGETAAEPLRGRLLSQRHLEAELKVLAIDGYRSADESRATPSFDELRAALDGAAARTRGAPPASQAPTWSVWPLGELLDPTQGGLPRWFADGGRLLIAGRRNGQPAELFLAPVLARGEAGPQRAQLSWIEGTLIPGWLEHRGARFAGAALGRFAWIDVGAVEEQVALMLQRERRLAGETARIVADPVEPAASRAERCRVEEPAEVALKLELRALREWRARDPSGDPATLLVDSLDAVLQHESTHLADVERFLPLSTKVWGQLLTLARLRFSPRRIEEWLELRAQCRALSRARNPWLVLADCASQLVGDDGLTPHGEGYRELLARLVEVLDEAPGDFRSLDRGGVLVQQLDRLTADELRRAARRLLEELDLPEE